MIIASYKDQANFQGIIASQYTSNVLSAWLAEHTLRYMCAPIASYIAWLVSYLRRSGRHFKITPSLIKKANMLDQPIV